MRYIVFGEDVLRGETNHHLLISMSKHSVYFIYVTASPLSSHLSCIKHVMGNLLPLCWLWPSGVFVLLCSPSPAPWPGVSVISGVASGSCCSRETHLKIMSSSPPAVIPRVSTICYVFFLCVSLLGSQLHLFTWSPSSWPPDRSSLPFLTPSFSICLSE